MHCRHLLAIFISMAVLDDEWLIQGSIDQAKSLAIALARDWKMEGVSRPCKDLCKKG